MGLSRRGSVRNNDGMVWPGFVDAVTTLLMVLMFVLTIFTVMQSVLRQTIDTQDTELSALSAQVAQLADALGLERNRAAALETEVGNLTASLAAAQAKGAEQASRIAALTADLAGAQGALTAAQAQVADLTQLLAAARGAEAPKADLLGTAKAILAERDAESAEAARRVALLNEQIAALRAQLGALQSLIDAAEARDAAAKVQLETLGGQLNSALAQVAAEQKRRAELEAAERVRLEAEKADLEKFRSEFFGQLRQVLAGRDGVRIVGDRFVFSSEVLFTPGSADLAPEGQQQIAGVVATLQEIAEQIPPGIDWILRVDGHTDTVPLSGTGEFRDNWQLSQARALSVVRYMQDELGFAPNRLAATGFGEWQPVAPGNSAVSRAQNRRIELKLTER